MKDIERETGSHKMGRGSAGRVLVSFLSLLAGMAWPGLGLGIAIAPGMHAHGQASHLDSSPAGEVLREIDDPHTGDRWLLMRNPDHAGGPGRLVRMDGVPARASALSPVSGIAALPSRPLDPVIHRGDRLTLEESTPKANVRLEAVALDAAPLAGSSLRVRVALGGKVVRARALGPGRVGLGTGIEVEP